jgi:parvulin-like peptidyl-prolyl isomerase
LLAATIGFPADDAAWDALDASAVLVTVNERPITKGDLEFELLWRRVPAEHESDVRRRFVVELIDRQLLSGFLQQRRVEVPEELIDRQIEQLRQLAKAADRDFDDVISSLGFNQASLRAHLKLPLAWRLHLNRVVTDRQLAEFFAEWREQFDGTRVRASQIVIAVPSHADDEEWRSAEQTLTRLRSEIAAGEIEFAEAARRHSTSPSRELGGDLGFFRFHGRLPAALARAAFELDTGELSQPLRSRFGVHLLMVTDRVAGQLSLEDVRRQVFDELSRQMWDQEADRLRGDASIEWRIDPEILGTAEP